MSWSNGGVITEADFRDLTFVNPVLLHASGNPDFFTGTVCEDAATRVLEGEAEERQWRRRLTRVSAPPRRRRATPGAPTRFDPAHHHVRLDPPEWAERRARPGRSGARPLHRAPTVRSPRRSRRPDWTLTHRVHRRADRAVAAPHAGCGWTRCARRTARVHRLPRVDRRVGRRNPRFPRLPAARRGPCRHAGIRVRDRRTQLNATTSTSRGSSCRGTQPRLQVPDLCAGFRVGGTMEASLDERRPATDA